MSVAVAVGTSRANLKVRTLGQPALLLTSIKSRLVSGRQQHTSRGMPLVIQMTCRVSTYHLIHLPQRGGASSSLNVQEPLQPQPHANSSLFHPKPLDHASSDQQNLWMLGAHSSEDEFQLHSPGFMAAFEEQMNQGFRHVSPVHSLNATDRIEFLGTRPIVPLFQPLTRMFLSVDTIEEVKVHAHDNMIKSIIDSSFFPADEAVLYTMAQRALDDAISQFSNGNSFQYIHSSADVYQYSGARQMEELHGGARRNPAAQ